MEGTLELLLRPMEWFDAAEPIVKAKEGAFNAKNVTYDFERLMEGGDCLNVQGLVRRSSRTCSQPAD